MLKNIPHKPAGVLTSAVFTAIPIEQDDDWTRLPKPGQFLCGLTRSHIYQLAARGLIRTVSIRQPHHKRGIRLIYKPSIAALIAKLDAEQNRATGPGGDASDNFTASDRRGSAARKTSSTDTKSGGGKVGAVLI